MRTVTRHPSRYSLLNAAVWSAALLSVIAWWALVVYLIASAT